MPITRTVPLPPVVVDVIKARADTAAWRLNQSLLEGPADRRLEIMQDAFVYEIATALRDLREERIKELRQ